MGAQSAYYICVMMGLYPIMGQDLYLLLPPAFDETTLVLGQTGRPLVLRTKCRGEGKYIVGVTADGSVFDRSWITHAELLGRKSWSSIWPMSPQAGARGTYHHRPCAERGPDLGAKALRPEHYSAIPYPDDIHRRAASRSLP